MPGLYSVSVLPHLKPCPAELSDVVLSPRLARFLRTRRHNRCVLCLWPVSVRGADTTDAGRRAALGGCSALPPGGQQGRA